ncbi:MAG: hypothetical protein CVU14_04910 [Bacteroidetes bacterium HGW-Bacteroidetes-9]|nr:MAG: hypothetical protein CVU14_04910 [Bacteroidetes bacterium HGW-Bacteroidetes-9]
MKAINLFRTIIVLSAFSMMFFSSCKQKSNDKELLPSDIIKNPNTADGTVGAEDMPVLEFEADFHDFGRVIQGEKVSFGFWFKNAGKSDLIISNVSSSCGCTVPDFPKTPVKPGERHKIDVKFDSENRRGFQNKTVTIISNAQPSTQVIRIKAEVILPEEIN